MSRRLPRVVILNATDPRSSPPSIGGGGETPSRARVSILDLDDLFRSPCFPDTTWYFDGNADDTVEHLLDLPTCNRVGSGPELPGDYTAFKQAQAARPTQRQYEASHSENAPDAQETQRRRLILAERISRAAKSTRAPRRRQGAKPGGAGGGN